MSDAIKKCQHKWTPSHKKVEFTKKGISPVPVMHVTCSECGARTWITELQWDEHQKGK